MAQDLFEQYAAQADPFAAYAVSDKPVAPPKEDSLGRKVIDFGKGVARTISAHPVETAAMVGGAIAAPLTGGTSLLPAMAAAGLGGAGGAGVGLMAKAVRGDADTPNTPLGVAEEMGKQGVTQGLMEGGGRLVSGALRMAGRRLYQSALAPTVAMRAENPNLITAGLEHAIPVSKGGEQKALDLMLASKGSADQLVADAAAAPGAPMVDPRQAVGGIAKAVSQVRDLPVARPQMRAIGDYGRQYLSEHPGPMSLTVAQRAVRATDKFYDATYRATMDRGNPITSGQAAAAVGINDATRGLLRDAVPGLQQQNATTSDLMGLTEALGRRTGNLANRMPVGMSHLVNAGIAGATGAATDKSKGVGTFLALEGVNNPYIASQLAIQGSRAASVPFQQLVRAAVMKLMASRDQPDR